MPREHKKKNFQIRIPTIHWAYESPYYFQGFSQLASLYASPTQNNNQSRDNATKNNSRIGPGYPISLGGVCVGACCVNFFFPSSLHARTTVALAGRPDRAGAPARGFRIASEVLNSPELLPDEKLARDSGISGCLARVCLLTIPPAAPGYGPAGWWVRRATSAEPDGDAHGPAVHRMVAMPVFAAARCGRNGDVATPQGPTRAELSGTYTVIINLNFFMTQYNADAHNTHAHSPL
jgi:hypothetical protein